MAVTPPPDPTSRVPGGFAGAALHAMRRRFRRTTRRVTAIPRLRKPRPGTPAGIEHHQLAQMPSTPGPVVVTCVDFSRDRVQFQKVEDMEDFILHHRPEWSAVRWINIDGLNDMRVIQALAEKYELHPLAIEDLLHVPQRPKVEAYGELSGDGEGEGDGKTAARGAPRLFVVVRMLELAEGHLHSEQISMFVGRTTLLTFQEAPGDVWDPIRQRLHKPASRLRTNGVGYLAYVLLDAIVDHCFPILEHFGDRIESLEEQVLDRPTQATITEIHALRRELLLFRREVWPMREVVHHLQREPHPCFNETTRTYLRDVYDHTVQIIDILETYREVSSGLVEAYMSAMSQRMNEVMKALTIIATIFIPMTFVAGVYGMNFERMPEMHWVHAYPWSYPIGFWAICGGIAAAFLWWFRRRGWL